MKKELINFCEFDKFAVHSFCAIHGVDESLNLGDITKVNEKEIADFNMMSWGFPCQSISVAGKQEGFVDKDGNKTRSGLYYDGIRILREKKPALSIIENVKNLTGKKFKEEFAQILKDLDECGYNSYYEVLNAKNYGIPQNRERVFIISIRKDIDNGKFKFPEGFDNGIRLKHILEENVDEKYYISQEKTDKLIEQLKDKTVSEYMKVSNAVTSNYKNGCANDEIEKHRRQLVIESTDPIRVMQVGNIVDTGEWDNPQRGRIYSADGCSPALNCCGGGGLEPKIIIEDFYANRDVREYHDCSPTLRSERQGLKVVEPMMVQKCGDRGTNNYSIKEISNTIPANPMSDRGQLLIEPVLDDKQAIENISSEYQFAKDKCFEFYNKHGYLPEMFNPYNQAEITSVAPTQTVSCNRSCSSATVLIKDINYRIRKLTPKECFRLMGFSDEDFNKAKYEAKEFSEEILRKFPNHKGKRIMEHGERIERMSDSQLYKQAGNSIVTYVLFNIYLELYKAMSYLFEDIKLSSFFSGIGAFEKALDMLFDHIENIKETK